MKNTPKFFLISIISSVFLSVAASAQVKTGIDVLQESGFSILAGKRVGLLTNPTGIDRNMRSLSTSFTLPKR